MEVSPQGFFKGTSEKHAGAGVLLHPAIDVAISVAARATQVMTDLGVAVDHHATSAEERDESGGSLTSSQRSAGAKASRFRKVWPFTVVCESLSTPVRPTRAFSSSSSRPSRSGS